MTAGSESEQPGPTPPLPPSIWAVAWASLAGQAVLLIAHGVRHAEGFAVAVSVILGALLVGHVAAGVVRGRPIRTVLAWVVLVLSFIAEGLSVVSEDDLGPGTLAALSLMTTAAALVGLAKFRRTDWCAWQRTRPSAHVGAPIGQLVAIGMLVGALGGVVGSADDRLDMRISVADN